MLPCLLFALPDTGSVMNRVIQEPSRQGMMPMLEAQTTLQEVLAAYPGARRALFRKYHLGGCSSCGFSPSETLAQLCSRSGSLNVDEVIVHIQASHDADRQLEIGAQEVMARRNHGERVR